MNKMIIASVFTVMSALAVQPAMADYDTVGSALVGGVAGAVIGHAMGGRNGAAVGAAIGSVGGVVLSANQPHDYDHRPVVYNQPAQPVYYQGYPEYQPVREVAYPVRQVVYYGNEDRGWDRGRWEEHRRWEHREWDHDQGEHRGWDHDRSDHQGWSHDENEQGYGHY
ncbi:glycine zipper family protein [Aquirhabdus sp.]|uniref:glycine zipper family protein n=1 Tax=Aquirhabdus sp. TaxID=2824160 RepID=UPI00396C637A